MDKRGYMGKLVLGIVCLIFAAVGMCVTVLFFFVSRAFDTAEKKEHAWVGRAPASLKETKHKKNVTLYGRDHVHGTVKSMFIKDMTKGTYVYTVNGKTYKRRVTKYLTTPHQMPYLTSAFYIKKFPRISYLKDDWQLYDIYAIMSLFFSVLLIFFGVEGVRSCLLG